MPAFLYVKNESNVSCESANAAVLKAWVDHRNSKGSSSRHFIIDWVTDSRKHWLRFDPVESQMHCLACETFRAPDAKGKLAWVTIGCNSLTARAINDHETMISGDHQRALVSLLQPASLIPAIVEKINVPTSLAFEANFKLIYFIAKHRTANRLFASLRELVEFVTGTEIWSNSFTALNASYTSNEIVAEMIIATAEFIRQDLFSRLRFGIVSAPTGDVSVDNPLTDYYCLIFDESMSVGAQSNLALLCKSVVSEQKSKVTLTQISMLVEESNSSPRLNVETHLLSVIPLGGATAEVVFNTVVKFCTKNRIPICNCLFTATDGCNVMLGSKSGVVVRIREINPLCIGHHCQGHRLALLAMDASEAAAYIANTFKSALSQLFVYCEYSGQHRGHLDDIQKFLYNQTRHVLKNSDTRWLSYSQVVDMLKKVFASIICLVIVDSYSNRSAEGTAKASGLKLLLIDDYFVRTLALWNDVLPLIAHFSRQTQERNIDFIQAANCFTQMIKDLTPLRDHPGVNELNCDAFMATVTTSVRRYGAKLAVENINSISRIHPSNAVYELEHFEFSQPSRRRLPFDTIRSTYMQALFDNVSRRFEKVEMLESLGLLFTPQLFPPPGSPYSVRSTYGEEALRFVHNHYKQDRVCENGSMRSVLTKDFSELRFQYTSFLSNTANDVYGSSVDKQLTATSLLNSFVNYTDSCRLLPEMFKLARVVLTIAISSADAERIFSSVNLTKTSLRNSMSSIMLDGLVMIHNEGPDDDKIVNFVEIAEYWHGLTSRRVPFSTSATGAVQTLSDHAMASLILPSTSDSYSVGETDLNLF